MERRIRDVLAGLEAIYWTATQRERLNAEAIQAREAQEQEAVYEDSEQDQQPERETRSDARRNPPVNQG